jgi:hypothetical protein
VGPDDLVAEHGETVGHEYVTDYALTGEGQVDPDSVVTQTDEIQAVVSAPSEQDQQRVDGRLSTGSLRLTVPSDRDVSGERGGRRDRFHVDDEVYEVVEVQADEHPITGTTKQTVLVDRLGGRS